MKDTTRMSARSVQISLPEELLARLVAERHPKLGRSAIIRQALQLYLEPIVSSPETTPCAGLRRMLARGFEELSEL